jgi:hypothetical protein
MSAKAATEFDHSEHGTRNLDWFATAATNALEHSADLAAVSEWLGHARVTATRLYEKRIVRVENSFGTPGDPRDRTQESRPDVFMAL